MTITHYVRIIYPTIDYQKMPKASSFIDRRIGKIKKGYRKEKVSVTQAKKPLCMCCSFYRHHTNKCDRV